MVDQSWHLNLSSETASKRIGEGHGVSHQDWTDVPMCDHSATHGKSTSPRALRFGSCQPQYRPQDSIILIFGPARKVPLILGNPHFPKYDTYGMFALGFLRSSCLKIPQMGKALGGPGWHVWGLCEGSKCF